MTRAPEALYSMQPAQMMPTQLAPAATSSQAQPDVQQLLRQQEQYFQTAMVLNKLQEQTGKILLFIENLDNRMTRLESITRDIYDRVSRSPPANQPAPVQQPPVQSQSIPVQSQSIGLSPVNAPSSSRRNRQEEADEEFARQLQEEEARRAKKAEKKEVEKKEADRKVRRDRERERERDKAGECPVCAQSLPLNALEAHVEQCLANSSLDQQTQEQKKSFFANWFKKKDGKPETPATPAPATASAVPVLPAGYQLPPGAQVIRAPPGTTYFPQAPYMMGGYPGSQLPPGAQVIYYNPMDQGNK
jgi:hypothetical protein